MNMMRNKNRNNNHNRNNRGGGRRYNNNGGGGGNRQQNDGQNLQRQKHHATQMLGKYNDLMRNAQNNGDRVDVEYYLQHIDHYNRVLADIGAIEAERFAAQREAHAGAQGNEQGGSEGEASGDAAAEGAAHADESGASNPPRQHRHPRRPYHQQQAPQQVAETQAPQAEAASNEIPLPGNILPPI